MFRVLPAATLLFFPCLPLLAAPDEAARTAAAIEAPAPPPVAPPLPGQLQAPPAPASAAPAPLPAPLPLPPRPALSPPSRIPEPPQPALTPAPAVPLSKAGSKPVSSTSSSGQFIVHGDDLKLRSAFSGRCEEISANLRDLLRDKQPWELPIVVLLKTGDAAKAPGPAASTTISQIAHGGFHLQVTVNIRGDLRPTDLRAELIRVLLAERILRHQKELATTRERLLPDWVFTGVLEALDYRKRARPSALFGAIFKSGKIYGIEEIIEASASAIEDGLSKTIYQTSCCALVLALLDQPDGGMRMMKFLNSLAADKRPERELLNQWFPGFAATPASLNKWWSLQMATLASPGFSEPLTAAETAKQLDQALTLRFKADPAEVPKPRPVVATAPAPAAESQAATPVAAPTTATTAGTSAEEPETDKPSFLSRLNPFGKKDPADDDVIADAAAEAALAETEAPKPAPERKPLFGRNRSPEPEETPAPAAPANPAPPKIAEVKTAETKPAAAKSSPPPPIEEAPPEETKEKGTILNPLKWFRGGKKDAPKEEPAESAKDPAQAATSLEARLLWAWSPLAADVWAMAESAEEKAPEPRPVEGFLGLRFGKKKDKDAAEPEAPKTETPAPQPAPKTAPPPATPAEEEAKPAPPAPIKIKPLFGTGKKAAAEPAPPEGEETPPAPTPPAPAAPTAKKPASAPAPAPAASTAKIDAALPIEDYAVIMKRKDRGEILRRNINALAALQTRSAVLFRPIIVEYSEVLSALLEGKTKGADERLRSLRTRSAAALAQSKAVRDFLDLYEANETPIFSGLFDDYLKLPETIESELPPRTDPLSSYLDALDREFSKE